MQAFGLNDRDQLINGTWMPRFGLGTWQSAEGPVVQEAVNAALATGYRLIDTAAIYGNEVSIGHAIAQSGLPREELFITTKVWNDAQRNGTVMEAFEGSLARLRMDYVDLYLIHWAVEGAFVDTWKVMQEIYASGRARAIGVSNFDPDQLDELLHDAEVVPTVNQCECHPRLQQRVLRSYCHDRDIRFQAWSPLLQGDLQLPELIPVALAHEKSIAQVILRWHLQSGHHVIPKSVTPERIVENALLYDFALSEDEMAILNALDAGQRIGPDPLNFGL